MTRRNIRKPEEGATVSPIQRDLSIFSQFEFERKPVGVRFLATRPDGMGRLNKVLDFCEMLVEAQKGNSFYVTKRNFTCVGPLILGMVDSDPVFESGRVGPMLEVFKNASANRRIYKFLPKLPKNTANYVAFCPLDKLPFPPDILIIAADSNQAEIIMRANSYTTGNMYSARGTPVAACAWLYIYPYVSGQLNFMIPGFSFGMRSRRLFPEGLLLISIPADLLPRIVKNLEHMNWVPHSYTIGREAHKRKVRRIVKSVRQASTT